MLSIENRKTLVAEALKRGDKPVEVNCLGVSEDKIRDIRKVLSAEIFNEKMGHWQRVMITEYIDACPFCGRLMRVRAVIGTTWSAACCAEHSETILK